MRRIALLTTILITAALTACGDSDDDDTGEQAAQLPAVTGEFGEKPTITSPDAEPGTALVTDVLLEGEGVDIAEGDLVVASYMGQIWRENTAFANSYDSGAPTSFNLDSNIIAGWVEGLAGKKVGSRVLLVVPPDKAFGEAGLPDAGLEPEDTLIFVIDVHATFTSASNVTGEATGDLGPELPAVVGVADAKPVITIPAGIEAPTQTVMEAVIAGDGEPVEDGDLLVVKYVGLSWSDGSQFDSSWDRDPQVSTFTLDDQVIKGWVEGLTGVNVGSRVLLVIPPASGYGEEGTPDGSIEPNETLVFAVDVLGAF